LHPGDDEIAIVVTRKRDLTPTLIRNASEAALSVAEVAAPRRLRAGIEALGMQVP
jgi:hypothetical protein